eukprot:14617512-Heterocapsa_arctica.AAC.1
MAPRLARHRGSPSADVRTRITADAKSMWIRLKKYFAMTVEGIHYAREAAYQTMHTLRRLGRPSRGGTASMGSVLGRPLEGDTR